MILNWIRDLYDTYENCKEEYAGRMIEGNALLPVSYTLLNAQIEVILNEEAEIIDALVVDKKEASTMLPCTIASANRTSHKVAHPLFDKLEYIAKELECEAEGKLLFEDYRNQLFDWCNTEGSPKQLKILLKYLDKGTLIQDLIERNVLVGEGGKLAEKSKENSGSKIFKVLTGSQENALVRFCIYHSDTGITDHLGENRTIQKSFLQYYLPQLGDKDLCMVTGLHQPITNLHPAYLRFSGDSAKLISSKDDFGIKYIGRSRDASEVMSVSYEASQKAHHALKWLIQKQGFKQDGLVILAWGVKRPEVIQPTSEIDGLINSFNQKPITTSHNYAEQLNQALRGYYNQRFQDPKEKVVVLSLDVATKGRLSITFYQSMSGSQLLQRMEQWYQSLGKSTVSIKEDQETKKTKRTSYTATPSFQKIVNALYGDVNSDNITKVKKKAYITLLSCMIDGRSLPRNYAQIVFDKFCKPLSFKDNTKRDDFLAIAYAIVRKCRNDSEQHQEEVWKMNVDYANKQTSYLWGRLLAYGEWLERRANSFPKEDRVTNATKYRKEFARNPVRTWRLIYDRLEPYKKKLIKKQHSYDVNMAEKGMFEIMQVLETREDNTKPLDDRFLLGFGAQLFELNDQRKKKEKGEIENELTEQN